MKTIKQQSQQLTHNKSPSQKPLYQSVFSPSTPLEQPPQSNQTLQSSKFQQTRMTFRDSLSQFPPIKTRVSLSPFRSNQKYQKIETLSRFQTINGFEKEKLEQGSEMERELKYISNLQESFEEECTDIQPKPTIGRESTRQFYRSYKNLQRIQEENEYGSIKDSIQTAMLTKSESLHVYPCKIGIIRSKGDEQNLQLQNQRYGDKYIEVLSEAIKYQGIKEINLTNNRIKQIGAGTLLPIVSRTSKIVDLSTNKIGYLGCQQIVKVLQLKESRVEQLILEDNSLGDKLVTLLCEGLVNHAPLQVLNISKNNITNASCVGISKLIKNNINLRELYLRWNQIQSNGAAVIFDALTLNENIMVFDGSFNSFGSHSTANSKNTDKLLDFFRKNTTLAHLDLTSNSFNFYDCTKIAEALKSNHSIFGLHFMGNHGYIDSKGFLVVDSTQETFREMHNTHHINGLHTTNQNKSYNNKCLALDVCWVCEGWHQENFEWISDVDCDPVFLHHNFTLYAGIYIPKKADGKFTYSMMIPPDKSYFFFTVNDLQLHANHYLQEEQINGLIKNVRLCDRRIQCQLDKLNYLIKKGRFQILARDGSPVIEVLPRIADAIYIAPKEAKEKKVWSFGISIWVTDFKPETQDTLRKCFNRDWECCKIPKLIKNQEELNDLQEYLWINYKAIKETYRHFSSINPSGDIWSISSNPLTEFINQSELIDGKTLKISDVVPNKYEYDKDLKFIATCSSAIEWKGNHRNPERALVRYQFMEFLVRLAEDKYLKHKLAINLLEATKLILTQCLPVMKYNAQKWRDDRYFNEQCDEVLKFYKAILNNLYFKYSRKKVKPGQKKFMCLDELQELCQRAGLISENLVDRDVNMAFNLSSSLEIDELESDKLFQMNQVEFYEAIARVSEKLSPQQYGKEGPIESYDERQKKGLHIKLESTIMKLFKNCTDDEFKDDYQIFLKSLFIY